jgi:hypothetical protein
MLYSHIAYASTRLLQIPCQRLIANQGNGLGWSGRLLLVVSIPA